MTISAKIIAHSKSSVTGKEIITYELEYPRFIHSELMTHRLFSRNAASSRAIPVTKMIEVLSETPCPIVHWGKNQPGMQAKEECDNLVDYAFSLDGKLEVLKESREEAWSRACGMAIERAMSFHAAGYHKQIVNRLLEPFQMMKTVVTSTEWDNWYWLRNHPDAQPEIKRLAEVMLEAKENSVAKELEPGMWHTPYYGEGYWGCLSPDSLEDALAISASCCAQVSYRKLDDSLEKAQDIFAKLIDSKPCHASPTEHQATPLVNAEYLYGEDGKPNINEWEEGVTHVDKNGSLWSGNFKGWIQHRQLIPDNACWNYSQEQDKE